MIKKVFHRNAAIAAAVATLLLPVEAMAYTGPGAGLTAIGSMIVLLSAIGFALVGFVWYPVKRLIKYFKRQRTADAAQGSK